MFRLQNLLLNYLVEILDCTQNGNDSASGRGNNIHSNQAHDLGISSTSSGLFINTFENTLHCMKSNLELIGNIFSRKREITQTFDFDSKIAPQLGAYHESLLLENYGVRVAKAPVLRSNNLSWSSTSKFAFAQRDAVVVTSNSKNTRELEISNPNTKVITQAKFISLDSSLEVLAVTSSSGLDIWNSEGDKWICSLPISKCFDTSPVQKGICSLPGTPFLFVGTSEGKLVLCYCDGKVVDVEDILIGHKNAICDISSSTRYIASGDDFGGVHVWVGESRELLCSFPSTGVPCNSLVTRRNLVLAGFDSGIIRMYDISLQQLSAEINAHCRPINALDIHPTENLFVSVGEDCYVNVWRYPDRDLKVFRVLSSIQIADNVLTGACFSKDGEYSIAVSAYDTNQIMILGI